MNSKLKTRTGVGNLLKPDGTLTNTDEEKVNMLNDYFISVFTRTDDLNEDPDVKEMDTFLDNIDVTVDEVLKKLSCLKTDKSAGPDSLHPKVLFEVRQSISYLLYVLFNKSLSEGVVPEDWKTAIVTPIFKNKGDKKQPCNYRPVSLTSVICKICESLIRDKVMKHLLDNNLLSDCQ